MRLQFKDHYPYYGKTDFKYTVYSRTIRNEKYSHGDQCHQKATKNLSQAVRNAKEHLTPLSVADYLVGTWDDFYSEVRKTEDKTPREYCDTWLELTGAHSLTSRTMRLVDTLLNMEDSALRSAGMLPSTLSDLRKFGELKAGTPDLEGHDLWFVCPVKHDCAVMPLELVFGTDGSVSFGKGNGVATYYKPGDVPQAIQDTMATLAIMEEGTYAAQIGMRVIGGMYVFTKQ